MEEKGRLLAFCFAIRMKGMPRKAFSNQDFLMTELQDLHNQLAGALSRIRHLEAEMSVGLELPRWQYLLARQHRWRRQLCIKGRNMTVGQLVTTVRANHYTPERASEELELPLEAIKEAMTYFEENRQLIEMEIYEERRRAGERGYPLEPKDLPR